MSEDRLERKEKEAGTDVVIESNLLKRLENFWFYYKWHLLVALFVILVIIVVVNQMSVKDSDDIVIMTAGPYKPTATQRKEIVTAFEQILPSDFNGDGEKAVGIAHTEVYSKDQLIEYQNKYKEENGVTPVINTSVNSENLKGFHNLIMAGEYSVCIIDKWLYEDVREAGGFKPLAELYPQGVPSCAVDEYAVRFKDTEFAKSFSCFEDLPDDTLLCIRTESVMGSIFNKKESDEKYLFAEQMFKAIIDFKPAE